MNCRQLKIGWLLLSLIAFALPAAAQQQISAGAVQIVGNGNTAYVTSGNALESDLHSVGGTTISLVSSGIPVYIEGGAGGTSAADEATVTPGTTPFAPSGCFMQTTVTNNALTNLQGGWMQCTAARALFVNQYSYAGTVLGAPSNYGTSPGAVEVAGVNAYITNTPAVTFSGQTVGLVAGTALVGKTVPLTACGTTNFDAAWQALTTSPVAIASSTTCVQNMGFCNTSSSTAYTVTVTDNAGTPVNVIDGTSIPPASCYNYPFNFLEFTSGIKWSASNVAVTGAIHGIQ